MSGASAVGGNLYDNVRSRGQRQHSSEVAPAALSNETSFLHVLCALILILHALDLKELSWAFRMACSATQRAGAGLPARAQMITAERTATAAALAKQALLRRPAGEAAPAGSGLPAQSPRRGALLRLEMCTRMQVAA